MDDINQVSHVFNLFAIHRGHSGVDNWKKNFLQLKTSFGIESLADACQESDQSKIVISCKEYVV
jgi:hypothetical protein